MMVKNWMRDTTPEQRARYHRNHDLKQRPIVYVWVSPDGIAEWVGRGTVKRAKHHRYTASWWTPRHILLTMACDSEWQAMEYEGKWGAHYEPRNNREGYRHARA